MKEIVFKGKKYEVTDEHFDYLFCKQSQGYTWKDENGELVAVERVPSEEEKKANRIAELKSFLSSTDYQAIKFAEGQIRAEDYEPMKLKRQAWRDEINSLEKQLNNTIINILRSVIRWLYLM